ncbi:MAG: hypothetical protein FWC41_10470 [Firmicutes bacterium]|nr:hypothetical protein [Bacillota bacterium]
MKAKWIKIIKQISVIVGIIVGIVTIIGIILGWFEKCASPEKPIIYQGSVQDDKTRSQIAGAKILFIGYTNEIPPCQTDNNGFFYISLSKEYPDVKIQVTHENYEPKEFHAHLVKDFLKTRNIIYLTPKESGVKQPTSETGQQERGKESVNKGNASKIMQEVQKLVDEAREIKNSSQADDIYHQAYNNLSISDQNKYKQEKDNILSLDLDTRVKNWNKFFQKIGY